ncbi:MAG: FHA domain-containing protein [Roseibacillus sp.]|nr:FHA domain-containing protein [Roseibacillus sp.]
MSDEIRTYLVGRRNSTVSCDISLPESEKSVSRKHLELTVTAGGRCYIVHLHPKNTTQVQAPDGSWKPISQDYVDMDTPLLLGTFRTTARSLVSQLSAPAPPSPPPSDSSDPGVEWDPDRGTFIRR